MLVGAILTVALVVFAVTAHGEALDAPRYWPFQQERIIVTVPPPRQETCPARRPRSMGLQTALAIPGAGKHRRLKNENQH
jgi:hypothetical protein